MLKRLTYKIVAVVLLVPFIAASTGLSIFIHNCACEGRVIATLFVEHKCHEEVVHTCCETMNLDIVNDSDSECGCNTEHFTIKVDEQFTISSTPILITGNDFIALQHFNKKNEVAGLDQGITENKNLYLPTNSPPIKPAGRILINLLHQSKTPDIIS